MKRNIPSSLKLSNRKIVYQLLQENNGLSRAEIARMTGISGATVIKIAEHLHDKNMIAYAGAEDFSGLGRKPMPIRFNPNFAYSICIFIEGKYTALGIVNAAGDVVVSKNITMHDLQAFLQTGVYHEIDLLMAENKLEKEKLIGIGMALPIAVDPHSRAVFRAPLLTENGIENLSDLLTAMETHYGLPVFVENDVNAAAYGEYRKKYKPHTPDLIYISLGTGLGSGLIINRKIWTGHSASAGEIGYMCFEETAHPHKEIGWLESKTSLEAVRQRFQVELQSLADIKDPQILEEISAYLARHIALAILNIHAVLDIETVILGGVLTRHLSPYLLPQVEKAMHRFSAYLPGIRYGQLENPGFTGLGYIVTENLLEDILS